MNLHDIAALITVRNYAVAVREDKNLFKGDKYSKLSQKINQIQAKLEDAILNFDVNSTNSVGVSYKVTCAKRDGSESPEGESQERPSQIPLKFSEEESDDNELLAKRIAEEKAKVASKKKTTKKIKKTS